MDFDKPLVGGSLPRYSWRVGVCDLVRSRLRGHKSQTCYWDRFIDGVLGLSEGDWSGK